MKATHYDLPCPMALEHECLEGPRSRLLLMYDERVLLWRQGDEYGYCNLDEFRGRSCFDPVLVLSLAADSFAPFSEMIQGILDRTKEEEHARELRAAEDKEDNFGY